MWTAECKRDRWSEKGLTLGHASVLPYRLGHRDGVKSSGVWSVFSQACAHMSRTSYRPTYSLRTASTR